MAAPITNWIFEKGTVTEKDRAALEKAHKMEAKDIKHGYRWMKINDRTKALIECDDDGNPTQRGQQHIQRLKSM